MIEELRFVRGAVGGKTALTQDLRHFRIKDNRITGFNGAICLSAPIDLDIEANPQADMFAKSIDNCQEAISIYMTKTGRLAVKSGGFRSYIPCLEEIVSEIHPAGERYECPQGVIEGLASVYPFISQDASRPWAMGASLSGGLVSATNNIVLIQAFVPGLNIPDVILPRGAVAEMLRIKENPTSVVTDGHTVTFYYSGGRYLSMMTYDATWPHDVVNGLFDKAHVEGEAPVPNGLMAALEGLKPFLERDELNSVFFRDGHIAVSAHEESGAEIDVEGLVGGPVFIAQQLQTVLDMSPRDFYYTNYPNPCMFYIGDNVRGIILGRRP